MEITLAKILAFSPTFSQKASLVGERGRKLQEDFATLWLAHLDGFSAVGSFGADHGFKNPIGYFVF